MPNSWLAARRWVGGGVPLWSGALNVGELAGSPAYGSSNVPSATLIAGDFSRLIIVSFFGGLEIDLSEGGTRFNQAQVGVRASVWADVAVATPAAFSVATSIT